MGIGASGKWGQEGEGARQLAGTRAQPLPQPQPPQQRQLPCAVPKELL